MTAQEYIDKNTKTLNQVIQELVEHNKNKLDKCGYIQFNESIQISPENRRVPVQFEWIDGIQLISGGIVSIIVWVSTKFSQDITGFLLREFPDEDQVEILNQLLEVFEL